MTHFLHRQTVVFPALVATTLVLSAMPAGAQEARPASALRVRPARIDVEVSFYDTVQVPAATTDTALAVVTRTFAQSGIDVGWKDCDSGDACTGHVARAIVRLGRSSAVMKQASPAVLGDAIIDRGTGSGVFATIYVDRVERMSERAETDVALLLGRAIAHELGHLLLGTNAHSPSGLMRAHWTETDVRRNLLSDWILSKKDAEAIRRRLR